MRMAIRFLVVFMAARVLAPPGVCLDDLSLPLARLLATTFSTHQRPGHSDDENRDGCCVCQLPAGVRAEPVAPPRPPAPPAPSLPPPYPTGPNAAHPIWRTAPSSFKSLNIAS